MTAIRLIVIPAVIALGMSACTWVRTEPGAEQVQLRSTGQVQGCEQLGHTTTSVRDRVAAVQRRATRVEDELADLARNSAAEMGGNVIVPDGPVRDGQRRFAIYRCP
ncbi:MAG: DUF4156 domain-containing protein [Wenzhouxiangella sp.]